MRLCLCRYGIPSGRIPSDRVVRRRRSSRRTISVDINDGPHSPAVSGSCQPGFGSLVVKRETLGRGRVGAELVRLFPGSILGMCDSNAALLLWLKCLPTCSLDRMQPQNSLISINCARCLREIPTCHTKKSFLVFLASLKVCIFSIQVQEPPTTAVHMQYTARLHTIRKKQVNTGGASCAHR